MLLGDTAFIKHSPSYLMLLWNYYLSYDLSVSWRLPSLFSSITGRMRGKQCLYWNRPRKNSFSFRYFPYLRHYSRYSSGESSMPCLSTILREKSLRTQKSFVWGIDSSSSLAYLQIIDSFWIAFSSIAPTELYSTILLSSKLMRKILPSWEESFSKEPKPSVSTIHRLTPLTSTGLLQRLMPRVQALGRGLVAKPLPSRKSQLSRHDLPLR